MQYIAGLAITALLLAGPAQADEACTETIAVQVNGMVCDFCARALEEVIGTREDVQAITVDLSSKMVTIHMLPQRTLDDATVTALVLDSGYDVANIDRRSEQCLSE